jgi:hypothetical protein
MIDVTKYKSTGMNFSSSLMILVDAVYFQRMSPKSKNISHRLSLLFYHKRRTLNLKGTYWDIWSRILYITPTYKNEEYTEFSRFFFALTDQEIKGRFDDATLRQIGLDIVREIRNNNYVFSVEWIKTGSIYTIKKIVKSNYLIERPAIIEWPKKLLEAYPEIEDARPGEED